MFTINNFISLSEIQIYHLQHIIYQFLSSELNNTTPYILIFLFIGGLLTSLNPCFLCMIPIIISYINNNNTKNKNKKYIFIIGLLSSLIFIISLSTIAHKYYNTIVLSTPIITSIIIIIIGLNLLQILNLNFFTIHEIAVYKLNIDPYTQSFIIGLVFGLSSSSCSTPILATILVWLSNNQNLLLGIMYITCYFLGYIIPTIILIEITINYNRIKIISKTWNSIMPLGGSCILGIGIFSLLEHIFID